MKPFNTITCDHLRLSPAIVRKDGLVIVGSQHGVKDDASAALMPSVSNVLMMMNCSSKTAAPLQVPMSHPIEDIQWLNASTAVIAAGPSMLLTKINECSDDLIAPQWIDTIMAHRESIGHIAPSLSGRDILSTADNTIHLWTLREETISTSTVTIPCNEVVGSVRWHPLDSPLFSWSTKQGTVVQYDTRTGSICCELSIQQEIYDLGTLTSHDYGQDGSTIICGSKDGVLSVFDMRKTAKTIWRMSLPSLLNQVGELRRHPAKSWFGIFGYPGFSLINVTTTKYERGWAQRGLVLKKDQVEYATKGNFGIDDPDVMVISDNCGKIQLYDVGSIA